MLRQWRLQRGSERRVRPGDRRRGDANRGSGGVDGKGAASFGSFLTLMEDALAEGTERNETRAVSRKR